MANKDFEKDTLQTAAGIVAKKGKKLAGEGLKWLAVFLILALTVVVLVQKGRIKKLTVKEPAPKSETVVISEETKLTVETIREVIAPASEMISYKYFYTDTGHFEKDKKIFKDKVKLPFTTEEVLYVYSGTIGVGIDLGDIKPELDTGEKVLMVTLPALKVMSHELNHDSFEYYDVKKSVFTEANLGDFNEFQQTLMAQQEEKLSEKTEFWANAKTHTEEVLTGLLSVSGKLDDYKIVYKWEK